MAATRNDDVLVSVVVLGLCYRNWNYPLPENGHTHVCDLHRDHGSEEAHRCAICNARWSGVRAPQVCQLDDCGCSGLAHA